MCVEPGAVTHSYNSSTWVMEVGGLGYIDSLMTNLVPTSKPPPPTNISWQFTVMG